MSNTPAILLTIFNRPDLTEKVFARIREARPERLFVAADGPRASRPGEAELCEATRRITEMIDWPCECERLYRHENLGCGRAMSEAISWFFGKVEEGVILEDDCLPDPTFFQFCAELLDRYRDDDKIATIGGIRHSPHGHLSECGFDSYCYCRYPMIWGWASWRRFWVNYDIAIDRWVKERNFHQWLPSDKHVRRFWEEIFDRVAEGRIDTWDYQVAFECLSNGYLSIQPAVNLVDNIGFDDRATHTTKCDEDSMPLPASPMDFPLHHPLVQTPSEVVARYVEVKIMNVPANEFVASFRRLKKFIRQVIERFVGGLNRKS